MKVVLSFTIICFFSFFLDAQDIDPRIIITDNTISSIDSRNMEPVDNQDLLNDELAERKEGRAPKLRVLKLILTPLIVEIGNRLVMDIQFGDLKSIQTKLSQ